LPRDAMHKRGLCRHAVSVCLTRSCILLKRINIPIFSPSGRHTILVLSVLSVMAVLRLGPHNWCKSCDLRLISGWLWRRCSQHAV